MTRETKIGLLVGLAFIIVVAILLSDPVNNASEPQAPIADTAQIVRQGTTTPAAANSQPAGALAVVAPARSAGHDRILTPAEADQDMPHADVRISPGNTPARPIIGGSASPLAQNDSQVAMQPSGSAVVIPPAPPVAPTPAPVPSNDPRQQAADAQNEQLVPADSQRPTSPSKNADDSAASADPAAPSPGKQRYTAEAGDSVSKMASRLMGANTKANRAAIIAANPSLRKDPNRVIVGETYVIPAAAVAQTPATPAPAEADSQSQSPTEVVQAPAPQKQPTRWYVVKPNDNLWRIATDEVGDSGAIAEIMTLNKDILKGSSTLRANMRLRLPPKTVATAE